MGGLSHAAKVRNVSNVGTGTLDSKGQARVDGIDPGTCRVTFPNLDKNMGEPICRLAGG